MGLERRVVITGLGACTPLGRDMDSLWENLIAGETSIRDVSETHPYLNDFNIKIGSLFPNFEMDLGKVGMEAKKAKRMSEFSAVALEASSEAIMASGILDVTDYGDDTGVSIGGGFGGLKDLDKSVRVTLEKGMGRVDKMIAAKAIPGSAAVNVALHYGFHAGDMASVTSACASGASNIIHGYHQIVHGDAKMMVCGGTGETAPLNYLAFGNLGALSSDDGDPTKVSRPFDRDRSGFVLGDGAGVVVLEDLKHARDRGAPILAELLSYSAKGDAFHLTAPDPNGAYAIRAMEEALDRARINRADIGYYNAHGTSTEYNDAMESRAVRAVFWGHADRLYTNSTKGMIGHALNAASGIESAVTIRSMNEGVMHPNRNLENPDKDGGCDLNYVGKDPVERNINYAMKGAFAFGGRNVFLVFGKDTWKR